MSTSPRLSPSIRRVVVSSFVSVLEQLLSPEYPLAVLREAAPTIQYVCTVSNAKVANNVSELSEIFDGVTVFDFYLLSPLPLAWMVSARRSNQPS